MIEVKIGDDIVFIEKKFVKLKEESLEPVVKNTDEEFTVPAVNSISGVANVKEDDEDDEFTFSLDDLDFTKKVDDDDEGEDDDGDKEIVNIKVGTEEPSYYNSEPEPTDLEVLSSKLKKSMKELEDIRAEMKNTFTSTDTISNTITSLKGMVDALKKDQEGLK